MFINDKLIFLELQKTGTSSIVRMIHSVFPGRQIRDRYGQKHVRLEEHPNHRLVVGSIRNPFAWYVSLWAYGCDGKGSLYWQNTSSPLRVATSLIKRSVLMKRERLLALRRIPPLLGNNPALWKDLYSDSSDPVRFRKWLSEISTRHGKQRLSEDYPVLPLRHVIGFYTFRFLFLFTHFKKWDRRAGELTSFDEVAKFYMDNNICTRFIRTEMLEEDVGKLLRDLGAPSEKKIAFPQRANQSSHLPIQDYYDDASRRLVMRQDRLLFDLFGYGEEP